MSRVSDEGVRIPSDASPKFVMVGVDLPGGRVRLYASRDIPPGRLYWGMRDTTAYAVAWHVEADMVNVLVIDADTWGEAFTRAFTIWENADRDKAISERTTRELKAEVDRGIELGSGSLPAVLPCCPASAPGPAERCLPPGQESGLGRIHPRHLGGCAPLGAVPVRVRDYPLNAHPLAAAACARSPVRHALQGTARHPGGCAPRAEAAPAALGLSRVQSPDNPVQAGPASSVIPGGGGSGRPAGRRLPRPGSTPR